SGGDPERASGKISVSVRKAPVSQRQVEMNWTDWISMLVSAGTKTDNPDAEEFSAYSLDTLPGKYKTEEIMLYGVDPDR
ncbi:MAG: hypothetical protein V8S14_06595, partial [Lachnospiraceae bacterium]